VSALRFYFVDVFADRPLTGNPVSLVPDADGLADPVMQAIAREFNQSETAFLLRPTRPGATWRLRAFTPIGAEVGGAGHHALGACLWLAQAGRLPAGTDLAQEIGGRVLPVEVTRAAGQPTVVSMDQSPPEFGASVTDRAALAAALGLAPGDLVPGQAAQVVSTGVGHLLVPLRDRATVDRAQPDPGRLLPLLRQSGGEGCYLYSRDPVSSGAAAYTRFVNPTVGITEDPATGTAAGPLAARLVVEGAAADGTTVIIEQGYALGRPSRIQVTVTGPRVQVSGSGLVVAEGTLAV
jgi:trans-2,3-dihydro-3-hydroxyanthranilate isomerase